MGKTVVEYKVEENPPSMAGCERMLNELAAEGWRVTGFTQYQILLKREREANEQELLTEDLG